MPFIAIILAGLFAATTAAAADSDPSQLSSGIYGGYAVETQSSAGMQGAAGSYVGFDAAWQPSALPVAVGLRSLAQGGQATAGDLYRMASGAMLSWRITQGWAIDSSLLRVRESGMAGRTKVYEAKGWAWQLGWERRQPLMANAELAFGGFIQSMRGDTAWQLSRQSLGRPTPARHQALSRGLRLGLIWQL